MSKLYLAGEMKKREFNDLLNVGMKRRLLSYYYHPDYTDDTEDSHKANLDLFLDSGAFSAFTKGVQIDINKYAAYLQKWGHIYNVVSNLDYIGGTDEGAKGTYENQKRLEGMGVKVMPVFHVREDVYWLERYIAEGYDYILIGGLVPESIPYCQERLDYLFGHILTNDDGTPKVKLHGFGLTAISLMSRYPWESVDSSSWMQKGMYGLCMLDTGTAFRAIVFSEVSNEARKSDGWHYNRLKGPQREAVDKWLEPTGITAREAMDDYLKRNIVNVYTYQRMERLIPKTFQHAEEGFF